jgi:hypothetical protein
MCFAGSRVLGTDTATKNGTSDYNASLPVRCCTNSSSPHTPLLDATRQKAVLRFTATRAALESRFRHIQMPAVP